MAQATPFRWQSASCSHVGRVRRINEDAMLDQPERGLWAVADGMGGHTLGDVASRMVVDALAHLPQTSTDAIRACLAEVNRRLMTEAAMRDVQVIGSTAVVLLASGSHCSCLWAGDSRIYRLRGGRLEQLTRDHSRVQEMVDRGELTPEAARISPLRNRITRALGVPGPLDLEARQLPSEASDLYLLCSDGLTGELKDSEIAAILEMDSLEAAADVLLALGEWPVGDQHVAAVGPQHRGRVRRMQAAGEHPGPRGSHLRVHRLNVFHDRLEDLGRGRVPVRLVDAEQVLLHGVHPPDATRPVDPLRAGAFIPYTNPDGADRHAPGPFGSVTFPLGMV